jgi:hypothetical protein
LSHLAKLIRPEERNPDAIYIAPYKDVFETPDPIDSDKVMVINNAKILQSYLNTLNGTANVPIGDAGGGWFSRLLSAAKVKTPYIDIELAKLFNRPTMATRRDTYREFVIRENGITSLQFAELFDHFTKTEIIHRPIVVIVPDPERESLLGKLQFARKDIEFIDTTKKEDSTIFVARRSPKSVDEYIQLYEKGIYHTAAAVSDRQLQSFKKKKSGEYTEVIFEIMRLHSRIMTEERQGLVVPVQDLLTRIKCWMQHADDNELRRWLNLKMYVLLQETYCTENPGPLNEALNIATACGSDFDRALCLRFAHFLDVDAALERYMLEQAEQTFRKHGSHELAYYAANNRLVSEFAVDRFNSNSLSEIINEIDIRIPQLHRRGDILYNYGVELLS